MSAKRTRKNKVGRPATGSTKTSPSLSLDEKLVSAARKAASKAGDSLSGLVEKAVREYLASVVAKLEGGEA